MKIIPVLKNFVVSGIFVGALTCPKAVHAESVLPKIQTKCDVFIRDSVPPKGTTSFNILSKAPKPDVIVQGIKKKAKYVVDLTQNILYKYSEKGKPEIAYLIASGKKSTPTHSGVRIVSHIETYPYRGAPRRSKRRRNPRAYGSKIIVLDRFDTKTGERSSIGEFIHGNGNSASLGKYVSHGCMRMDNEVIKELAKDTKRGDLVLILPNKN